MSLPGYAVTGDAELEEAVRDKTSYDSNTDELPGDETSGQMEGIINDAKRYLHGKTGSDQWYTDLQYGQALVAVTAMKAKEAVENINISSYGIGDETLSFTNADPDDSQQIQAWSSEAEEMLNLSDVAFPNEQNHQLRNTGSFIG